jgi:hypothetical protein
VFLNTGQSCTHPPILLLTHGVLPCTALVFVNTYWHGVGTEGGLAVVKGCDAEGLEKVEERVWVPLHLTFVYAPLCHAYHVFINTAQLVAVTNSARVDQHDTCRMVRLGWRGFMRKGTEGVQRQWL